MTAVITTLHRTCRIIFLLIPIILVIVQNINIVFIKSFERARDAENKVTAAKCPDSRRVARGTGQESPRVEIVVK